MKKIESWGRYFNYEHSFVTPVWRDQSIDFNSDTSSLSYFLPHGLGRSYGDSCLNDQGTLIQCASLNQFISFDQESGLLRCEAGVSLAKILDVIVPLGWFLPVTPGTKFVTLGGAIGNDVHGKNHVQVGAFGCHVTQLELLRSTDKKGKEKQTRVICSQTENANLFSATIGGLGLTGVIVWAEIQLIPITNAFIQEENFQCQNLDEMMMLFEESSADYQYTVAWIDCLAKDSELGRGIFTRGNHCTNTNPPKIHKSRSRKIIPVVFPPGCLNKLTVKAFNYLYFRKLGGVQQSARIDYDRFFYPLDAIHHWNRLYGPKGFIQYQCVLVEDALDAMKELLQRIAHSGQPSPLNVLKKFGDVESPGLLSFPRKGLTLALDFPNRGEKTLQLCRELDGIVKQSKGALYPAKDSRMSAEMFEFSFSELEQFKSLIDPKFSSSFWRRVQLN